MVSETTDRRDKGLLQQKSGFTIGGPIQMHQQQYLRRTEQARRRYVRAACIRTHKATLY
jgi:hypothetical protein